MAFSGLHFQVFVDLIIEGAVHGLLELLVFEFMNWRIQNFSSVPALLFRTLQHVDRLQHIQLALETIQQVAWNFFRTAEVGIDQTREIFILIKEVCFSRLECTNELRVVAG